MRRTSSPGEQKETLLLSSSNVSNVSVFCLFSFRPDSLERLLFLVAVLLLEDDFPSDMTEHTDKQTPLVVIRDTERDDHGGSGQELRWSESDDL